MAAKAGDLAAAFGWRLEPCGLADAGICAEATTRDDAAGSELRATGKDYAAALCIRAGALTDPLSAPARINAGIFADGEASVGVAGLVDGARGKRDGS
jgi:hypothetical protein